jgi:PAS domain S-box-containing protein
MFRFFHRLKVSQKLGLISVLFLIPDTVLLCLFLISINSFIRFAEWEQYGNEYQRPLEILLEEIPSHHLALREGLGVPTDARRLEEIRQRVDAAFMALVRVDQRLGESLQFTQEGLAKRQREHCRVGVLKSEWDTLKSSSGLSEAARSEAHRHLVDDVRTMITHVGDNSNLILDPDLDSYYLMDVTLLALPQMQERLWRATEFAVRAAGKGSPTEEDRRQLAVFAALLQESDLDRVVGSARTALNEDPNFYGVSPTLEPRIQPLLAEFKKAGDAFIGAIHQLGNFQSPGITAVEIDALGAKARERSFALWRASAEELDGLLALRTHHFHVRRARSLILTALALTAAVSFVWFITHSISGPLTRQANQLRDSNEALLGEITERRRIEGALRTAEERYRSIFENAGEGIFQTTAEGTYVAANPALARMYGFETVEELQATLRTVDRSLYLEPGRREEFRRQIEKSGRLAGFESQVVRRDGTVIWIAERARMVRDASGAFLYYEGTVEEITERKAHEAEVERLHAELVETSRLAGMAEIATGVLHNVGNVLNSMNVSASEVRDRLSGSRISHLRKSVNLLGEHRTDLGSFLTLDPRGQALPGFLRRLTGLLEEERETLMKEMDSMMRHVEHLKQIVSTQQSHARLFGVMETLRPQTLVDDALQLAGGSLERHGIRVERDFSSRTSVNADRHKVLQIMVNLLRNAKQSITEHNPPDRSVRVALSDHRAGRVSISVSDNGGGIAPENLSRIFQHGFTTKKSGHGFGLHASILAAREMNGDILVQSDGVGHGATFTLELPTSTGE